MVLVYSRSHEFEFFFFFAWGLGGGGGGGGEHFWGYPYVLPRENELDHSLLVLPEISNCKMRIQNVFPQENGYKSRQTPKLKPTVL